MAAFAEVLGRLIDGGDLGRDEAREVMASLLAGDLTPGQIGGLLVAFRSKAPTVEEMCGLLDAMTAAAERVEVPAGAIDTCGTGGSEQRREAVFHVSTIAALAAAAAGAVVCKHGNRQASATSGSADLLEALGVDIGLGPEGVARCVREVGMGFCMAPRFHPGMRHAGPVRRELGVRTVVNLVAPLANPAGVRRQVVGVADPAMADRLAAVLAARGAERAWVVHGSDGLDELTTTGPSRVVEVAGGEVRAFEVDPAAVGLAVARPGDLRGGDTAANVTIARRVLDGGGGPHRDIAALNAGAALVVAGVCDDLAAGVEAAGAALDGGGAARVLERLVEVSTAAAPG